MIKNKNLLVVFLTICSISVFAQESKTTFKLYGFSRSDFYSDTRKMNASVLDLFSFYPTYKDLNADGEDLNALSSAGLSSITTRMGLDFSTSAGIFGSKTAVAKIETDFGGSPTYMLLRIRQAYTQILWDKSALLVGQTWHPMFVTATQPNVLSLNTGSPFQPFNRSPQIRYDYQMNNVKLTAAAIYQMMYTSQGPEGGSSTYQKNAMLPDLYVSLEYKKNHLLVGLGGDYKSILPERYITDGTSVKHVNHNTLNTPAIMGYGVYTNGKLAIKAKAIFGQNLVEHSIIGGYAITPKNEYIPYNSFTSFIHFNYGTTHQLGLLLGYSANLGPSKTIIGNSNFYGFGVANANTSNVKMVGNMFRITPTYSYNIKNWRMGVELEYTNAAWGNRSATNGEILHLDRTSNYRIYAILMYKF